jgi:hypothetical protein
MSIAKWAAPGVRSANLAGSVLNSLSNGSESAFIAYDNSTNRDFYALITLKLGLINPSTGSSITLKVYSGEVTDTPDRVGSLADTYTTQLTVIGTAKIITFPLVRLYPFPCQFTVVNNTGVSFAASANELYVRPYNEDVT